LFFIFSIGFSGGGIQTLDFGMMVRVFYHCTIAAGQTFKGKHAKKHDSKLVQDDGSKIQRTKKNSFQFCIFTVSKKRNFFLAEMKTFFFFACPVASMQIRDVPFRRKGHWPTKNPSPRYFL
jgi:hypothetical protein